MLNWSTTCFMMLYLDNEKHGLCISVMGEMAIA